MTKRVLIGAALLGLVLPAAARASRADCWPKGTRTMQHSEHARVYAVQTSRGQLTYGCLYSTGRRVWLDEEIDGDPYKDAEPPYRLAGRYVAHRAVYLPAESYQGSEHGVDVVDLRTGRVRRSARYAWDDGRPYDPEVPPDPRIAPFALTRAGNAAWISSYGEPQLWRLDSRGPKLLDQANQLGALRVTANRVHWVRDGTPKVASLR
jgi:hypothetical protein